MNGNITVQYDISGLSQKTSEMLGALLGSGHGIGEIQQALMVETGQLAGRLGDAVGPTTKAKGMKPIDREVKGHLRILPVSNLDSDQQYSGTADFTWIYASPYALVGINDEDNISKSGNQEALSTFIASRKLAPRGNAFVKVGRRGKQAVVRLNRAAVSRGQMNYIRRSMGERVGQLRAAFYRIAKHYVESKRVPAWVQAKFLTVEANGKSKLNESGLRSGAESFIEFTITSPGVVSNERLAEKMQGAIKATQMSVEAKLKKISAGAKYIFTTGQVYFEK